MAEFQEVMKQFSRMCRFYQSRRSCPMECPMHGLDIQQCRKQLVDAYADAEYAVMEWASEHPEPVYEYPTWWEYLQNIGVLDVNVHQTTGISYATDRICTERVPKDIAEALGIKPKVVKWDG